MEQKREEHAFNRLIRDFYPLPDEMKIKLFRHMADNAYSEQVKEQFDTLAENLNRQSVFAPLFELQ